MNKEPSQHLYFIKLLQDALESDFPKTALKDAISEIQSKSSQAEFKIGYEHFLRFIQVIEDEILTNTDIRNSVEYWHNLQKGIDILIDDFKGSTEERQEVLGYFKDDIDFAQLKHEIESSIEEKAPLLIEISRDDQNIGSFEWSPSKEAFVQRGVTPGDYMVRLSNGRLLWHSRIDENQLQWSLAFPGREYPVAAMSEPLRAEPSISDKICDGSFRLDVIPGLETGTIVITRISRGK